MQRIFFLILSISFGLASCHPKSQHNQINVFCASSLEPVMVAIKKSWAKNHQIAIALNAASSGTLARQIEHGAPADIYISANKAWMDHLQKNLPLKNAPKTMARNRLAIVTPNHQQDTSANAPMPGVLLHSDARIATGDPAHVPLGKYARESIDFYHIFDALQPRLLLTKDARSALRLVEMGEAGLGIVYQSDALLSDRVKILSLIPDDCHSPIIYQSIVLQRQRREVMDFEAFLSSSVADSIFAAHGFTPVVLP